MTGISNNIASDPPFNPGANFRLNLAGILFSVICALIIFQMNRIQSNTVAQKISDQTTQRYSYFNERVYPERGNIYDRDGRLLAGNKNIYEVGVNLPDVVDPNTIAETLAVVIGMDNISLPYEELIVMIDPKQDAGRIYVRLADFIEPEKIARLEQIRDHYREQENSRGKRDQDTPSLEGLVWEPHLQRSYPEHELASNILGFYSWRDREEGHGYFGVEEKYDDLLAGTPIDIEIPLDPNLVMDIPNIPPGDSLILTIDREIQANVERIMEDAVEETGSESGTAIVMDPRTGEILAMTTTPRIDPNTYWDYAEVFPDNAPFNRAVGEVYEPGSIFKILTMAAAIDSDTVTPDTPFLDEGYIMVGGVVIKNWNERPWGPQTMLTCMQHSLNVCLAWVATELGPSLFYDYMESFGIHRRTNIDLADEMNWPLSQPGDPNWYPINLGTNSYGQGVAVTPIQMISAVSAIANDGKIMAPHVLRGVISNGHQRNNTPQVIYSPVSKETAHTLNEMLAASLEEEASTALVPGYRVAGKTGTANIPDNKSGGYLKNKTNASFIGWGPVDDPRFLVFVWLEKPTSDIWGSVVAAPVFKEIFQYLVVYDGLPPDDMRLRLYKSQGEG